MNYSFKPGVEIQNFITEEVLGNLWRGWGTQAFWASLFLHPLNQFVLKIWNKSHKKIYLPNYISIFPPENNALFCDFSEQLILWYRFGILTYNISDWSDWNNHTNHFPQLYWLRGKLRKFKYLATFIFYIMYMCIYILTTVFYKQYHFLL